MSTEAAGRSSDDSPPQAVNGDGNSSPGVQQEHLLCRLVSLAWNTHLAELSRESMKYITKNVAGGEWVARPEN